MIPLIAFLWFWFWRAHQWTGGDSEQWEREIHGGVWLRKRQMLPFGFMQATYQITNRLMGWPAFRAINFISCLSGAVAMLACWRHFHDRRDAYWAIAIIGSAGFTTIFYGHIETYAQPVAALLFHFLALRRYLQNRWPLWSVTATFSLVVWFHLVILYALPVLLLAIGFSYREKPFERKEIFRLILSLAPIGLLLIIFKFTNWGKGEFIGPHFIVPFKELMRRPWVMFTHRHLATKFWFFVWNGGIAGALGLGIFVRSINRKGRISFILWLFLYFLCFMVFTLVWNPDAGIRDFDLFCFPWVVAVLAFAEEAMTLPLRSIVIGLALGFNIFLFLTRTVVFADLENRHYGAIDISMAQGTDQFFILMDQRKKLSERNDFVPTGSHEIVVVPTLKNWRCAINVKKGERYLFEFDGENFQFKGRESQTKRFIRIKAFK